MILSVLAVALGAGAAAALLFLDRFRGGVALLAVLALLVPVLFVSVFEILPAFAHMAS